MSRIQLSSGRLFDYLNPTPLTLEEVATALSKICRFGGNCRGFYSVAQHAVFVSHLVPPEHAFAALHHDDAEAVMYDIPRPLKMLLPDYRKLEATVNHAILAGFGLPAEMPPEVKRADDTALVTERRDLMPAPEPWQTAEWAKYDHIPPHPERIWPWDSIIAARLFLSRHVELAPR